MNESHKQHEGENGLAKATVIQVHRTILQSLPKKIMKQAVVVKNRNTNIHFESEEQWKKAKN